jgi:GTPase Era involved in 16S rRNA processing
MENNVKNPRNSMSLGMSYTTKEINKEILQTQNHTDLLVFYIDYIRNYKELTEEMMENIKRFNDDSKMLLIIEYNKVIKAVNSLLG